MHGCACPSLLMSTPSSTFPPPPFEPEPLNPGEGRTVGDVPGFVRDRGFERPEPTPRSPREDVLCDRSAFGGGNVGEGPSGAPGKGAFVAEEGAGLEPMEGQGTRPDAWRARHVADGEGCCFGHPSLQARRTCHVENWGVRKGCRPPLSEGSTFVPIQGL